MRKTNTLKYDMFQHLQCLKEPLKKIILPTGHPICTMHINNSSKLTDIPSPCIYLQHINYDKLKLSKAIKLNHTLHKHSNQYNTIQKLHRIIIIIITTKSNMLK